MNPPQAVLLAAAFLAAVRVAQATEPAVITVPASTSSLNGPLRAELLAMSAEDQRVRQSTGPSATSAQLEEWRAVDARNARRFQEIIAQYGWPGKSLVGVDGAHQAWLLVQHCDPEFQEKCLPLLEKAVAVGEATGKDYAYLLDRVLMHRGQPQIYGTQYRTTNGKTVVHPIENPDQVDERRRSVGLGPWADYDQRMRKRDDDALAQVKNPELRQEIFRMMAEAMRVHRVSRAGKSADERQEMLTVDAANMKRMKDILAEHGWPGDSLVGADAARNAAQFVMLQGNPTFWEECLPHLEKAWKAGEAGSAEYAGMVDALRVAQGKPQLYGTMSTKQNGRSELSPIEDPEHLDERRKAIGLGPLTGAK